MTVEVRVRRWGNSLGVILPKDFVEKEMIQENETIIIERVRKADLSSDFGSLKRKMKGQKFKDMIREGSM